jgi:hypothetical protein
MMVYSKGGCQRHCTRRLIPLRARGCNPCQQRCCLASLQRSSAHRCKAAARSDQCLVDVSLELEDPGQTERKQV